MPLNDADKILIQGLQDQLAELDSEAAQIKATINGLCRRRGVEPMFAESDLAGGIGASPQLQSDTFYGQKLNTAIRQCLEMRKTSGGGPASVRDLYDMLVEGGYHFTTKSADNAMRSLRSSLNKSSHTFHRLPNGDYGLLEWYPEAKTTKKNKDESDDSDAAEGEEVVAAEAEEK